jgi:hypothetical protein
MSVRVQSRAVGLGLRRTRSRRHDEIALARARGERGEFLNEVLRTKNDVGRAIAPAVLEPIGQAAVLAPCQAFGRDRWTRTVAAQAFERPHDCTGLRFAETQVEAIMYQLLRRYRWTVPSAYRIRPAGADLEAARRVRRCASSASIGISRGRPARICGGFAPSVSRLPAIGEHRLVHAGHCFVEVDEPQRGVRGHGLRPTARDPGLAVVLAA